MTLLIPVGIVNSQTLITTENYSYLSDDIDSEDYKPQIVSEPQSTAQNPTTLENQKPGSANWVLKAGGYKISDDKNNQIKGYANKVSVNKGESLNLKISVNPAQNFRMEVYRIGWYQGLGGRLMRSVGPLQGNKQPNCPINQYGTVECKWTTSYKLTIPNNENWVSGAYLVKIINSRGYSNWINFTVRDDQRSSDILFQNSVNTWQAYNHWGGRSLYSDPRAFKVSFDRPYHTQGSRIQSWEIHMIRFLERNGYDVTYTTNVDTDNRPATLLSHKALLSVGHDEYWSWEMRNNVEAARDAGVNIGFFGGNDAYWQVRYEKSSSGIENRVLVGYKQYLQQDPYYSSSDPNKRKRTTGLFRRNIVNRPEQVMIGTMYGKNLGTHNANLPWTVLNQDHWIYEGTELRNGDIIPNVFGHEYNTIYSDHPKANNGNYTILSRTNGSPDAISTIYEAPSGAFVFSAGTIDWAWLLDPHDSYEYFVNDKIQIITKNILNKFTGVTPTPTPSQIPTPTFSPTPSPTVTPGV